MQIHVLTALIASLVGLVLLFVNGYLVRKGVSEVRSEVVRTLELVGVHAAGTDEISVPKVEGKILIRPLGAWSLVSFRGKSSKQLQFVQRTVIKYLQHPISSGQA